MGQALGEPGEEGVSLREAGETQGEAVQEARSLLDGKGRVEFRGQPVSNGSGPCPC